ncbi:MAG: CAIB/BAIF family protein, partial [uncultured Craurococcus sp.]
AALPGALRAGCQPRDRRTLLRDAARGLRGGGRQGGAAGRRLVPRPLDPGGHAERHACRLQPRQAERGARPAGGAGARGLQGAGGAGGRDAGGLPPRRRAAHRRGAGGGQGRHRLPLHFGLRAAGAAFRAALHGQRGAGLFGDGLAQYRHGWRAAPHRQPDDGRHGHRHLGLRRGAGGAGRAVAGPGGGDGAAAAGARCLADAGGGGADGLQRRRAGAARAGAAARQRAFGDIPGQRRALVHGGDAAGAGIRHALRDRRPAGAGGGPALRQLRRAGGAPGGAAAAASGGLHAKPGDGMGGALPVGADALRPGQHAARLAGGPACAGGRRRGAARAAGARHPALPQAAGARALERAGTGARRAYRGGAGGTWAL